MKNAISFGLWCEEAHAAALRLMGLAWFLFYKHLTPTALKMSKLLLKDSKILHRLIEV
jgi:hypothetical protein